ncbi:MAG: Holliday junction branch migration protein RuvA [Thermoanaerobaculia bacterium]
MIGYLKGTLLDVSPNLVLLDVGGVGYEVKIPLSTYYEVQKVEGGTAAFHVHTHVREDALLLFGFWTARERQLFEKLISVSGIGPKLAQTVLSGIPPDDLVAALGSRDVRALSSVPGIGKKTAERMVVDLADKVGALAVEAPAKPVVAESDLVLALLNLGYKRSAAERAIVQVTRENPDGSFADQLRAGLKLLSRV